MADEPLIDPRLPSINDPFNLFGCNELPFPLTLGEDQILKHILGICGSDYQMAKRAYDSIVCMWAKKNLDNVVPQITSLSPSSSEQPTWLNSFPLTVFGSNFRIGAKVLFKGKSALATTFMSPTELRSTISFGGIQYLDEICSVQVMNPSGMLSNSLDYTLQNKTPIIGEVQYAGKVFTECQQGQDIGHLSVRDNGSYCFCKESSIYVDESKLFTTFGTVSELTARYTFGLEGVWNITVRHYGRISNPYPITVHPVTRPFMNSISPTSGSSATALNPLIVDGTDFDQHCIVHYARQATLYEPIPVSTKFVSSTRLDAFFTPGLPTGIISVDVHDRYGTASAARNFTIT